ncbi:HTH_Tnp_Tc3_2 domain-containing protein [Trichonephila clavipes]|nr:HTH_Tnp_Tc3_2 domain-containing protein [Trichonephila clavipes]
MLKDLFGMRPLCIEQWLRDGTASRRPSLGRPRDSTESEDHRVRLTAVAHSTVLEAEIQAAVGITVKQGTLRNRTEWRSAGFSDESRLYLCASDGRVSVQRRSGERLQPNCLWFKDSPNLNLESCSEEQFSIRQQEHSHGYPKYTDCKFVRQSGNSTYSTAIHEQHSKGVFQQYNAHPNTIIEKQCDLQSVDMQHWPVRSPNRSPIEPVSDIIRR